MRNQRIRQWESENLFLPPQILDREPEPLAPDTEFLFNNQVVAGANTVVLPKICVRSGKAADLQRFTSRLTFTPRWYANLRLTMVALSLMGFLPILVNAESLGRLLRNGDLLLLIVTATACIGLAATVALVFGTFFMRHSMEVTWWTEKRFVVSRKRRLLKLVAVAILLIAITALIQKFPAPVDTFGILSGIIAILTLLALSSENRPLRIVGQQDRLFLISGFSSEFLQELRRMVEHYNKHSHSDRNSLHVG